jgi:uncharacterized heparinase superfamily protein
MLRLGLEAPHFLTRLQPRMGALLRFLTNSAGHTPTSHGGGDGRNGLAAAALRPFGDMQARFSFARLSGFQRVLAGDLAVYLDSGAGPDTPNGARAHASALALHVEDGDETLITACGAHADLEPVLREAARRTPAHSVLSLDNEDSASFAEHGETGVRGPVGPAGVSARRLEEADQLLLEGQHGGWRVRHGLVYMRRLYVAQDGSRITGEDSLSRPQSESLATSGPVPYAIRFHLHPDVLVSEAPDGKSIFLGLPREKKIWRFRSEATAVLESSRYWGGGSSVGTVQIVMNGQADPQGDGSRSPNRVRWSFTRVEPGD